MIYFLRYQRFMNTNMNIYEYSMHICLLPWIAFGIYSPKKALGFLRSSLKMCVQNEQVNCITNPEQVARVNIKKYDTHE